MRVGWRVVCVWHVGCMAAVCGGWVVVVCEGLCGVGACWGRWCGRVVVVACVCVGWWWWWWWYDGGGWVCGGVMGRCDGVGDGVRWAVDGWWWAVGGAEV